MKIANDCDFKAFHYEIKKRRQYLPKTHFKYAL